VQGNLDGGHMILPQSSARITSLQAEGKVTRAKLLALVPQEFTMAQLAQAGGITKSAASAQIQKMVRWKEIGPISEYKTPRTYRKVSK
jgi:hypothetical protein